MRPERQTYITCLQKGNPFTINFYFMDLENEFEVNTGGGGEAPQSDTAIF